MSASELPRDVVSIIRLNTSNYCKQKYEDLVGDDPDKSVYKARLKKRGEMPGEESGDYLSLGDKTAIERALKKSDTITCNLLFFQHEKDAIIKIGIANCTIRKGDYKGQSAHEFKTRGKVMSWNLQNRICPAIKNVFNLLSFTNVAEDNGGFVLLAHSKSLAEAVRLLTFDVSSQHVYWRSDILSSDILNSERLFNESPSSNSEDLVRRDYSRIVQSRAFRRMVDKAQIYGAERGVHYRTRMTHTLVVARIAREIAVRLGGDELLAETIALAHDLGHTPFGHQGERTIQEMLKKHCGPCFGGGFKHNYQSVRVLSLLEEGYPGFAGLNVSWKVLEGALYHTKTSSDFDFFELDSMYLQNKDWFDTYVIHKNADQNAENRKKYHHSWTLEGQIVAMADEIAQRSHDIDDGIMSGRIFYEEILELLGRFGLTNYQQRIRQAVDDVLSVQDASIGQRYASEIDVLRSVVSEEVMQILIDDVCEASKVLVDNTLKDADGFLKELVIKLSVTAHALNSCLEGVIKRRVLSSCDVAEFDVNAHKIVSSLYEQFLQRPDLLPEEVLIRYRNMQSAAGLKDVLDFTNCDFDARRDEIKLIRKYGSLLNIHSPQVQYYAEVQHDSFEPWISLARINVALLSSGSSYFDQSDWKDVKDEFFGCVHDDLLYECEGIETGCRTSEYWRNKVEDLRQNQYEEEYGPVLTASEDELINLGYSKVKWKFLSAVVKKGNSIPLDNPYGQIDEIRYIIKWIYLNRVIADYLADMTDTMAKDEYERVCHYR